MISKMNMIHLTGILVILYLWSNRDKGVVE
jgi:hypothetical protein